MTQLTLNVKISNTTKITSFFANFDKKSNLFDSKNIHKSTQTVMKRIKTFKQMHDNIKIMQNKFVIYQNKKRKMTSQLKEKDKIYLLTKNLTTRKKSKKLNHVKIELFFIKIQKKRVNYELNLFKDIKIHSIFHILLLESIDSKTFIQKTFHYHVQKKNEYEIEEILQQDDQRFLIK